MKVIKKILVTVVIAAILVAAGMFGYMKFNRWHQDQMALGQQKAEAECLEVVHQLESELAQLRAQIEAERQTARPGDENLPAVFGTATPGLANVGQPVDCASIDGQVKAFFTYLDSRPYLASHNLDGGSAGFFHTCVSLLMADPPVNVGEMTEMFRLVKNVTHFYRVLGKERLLLAKDVLVSERRVIEAALSVFYAHGVECGKPLPGDAAPLSIERLYDYAGYFLNTLGGRSYLLRRESKTRMLINYYAILIVDRANDEKFNPYGIDLRPYIDYLFYDIANQKDLAYRERYLTRLKTLKDKYM
ncbi:hypothetical protein DESC_830045 [Desulfosarcina cetonica]|nr:hypothetical protein DESC_830045 [Desulfosarcina cetonica]